MIAVALALSLVPAVAWSDEPSAPTDADKTRARELFENGRMLYDEGRYEEAIVAWDESYKLTNHPDLLYNVAGAYEKLGKYKAALDYLNRYRSFAPADERVTLDRRMRALEERLDAQKAAAVATPPVDTTAVVVPPPPDPTPTEPKRGPRVAPWLLVGGGTVGLAAGTVFTVQALGAKGSVTSTCVQRDAGYVCPDAARAAVDAYGRGSRRSVAAYGVGSGLLGVGFALALGGGSSDVVVIADFALDTAGVRVGGRF